MIKRTLFAVVCLAVAGSAFAQTEANPDITETVEYSAGKYKVETNHFWDNWFISAGAGGQVYVGDHDRQAALGDRIAPALDVAVGKWFTPGIGVRAVYSGLSIKGATQNSVHGTGEAVPGKGGDGYWLEKQKFNFHNVHLDAMFNLTNLIGGYREDRLYNLSAYGGVGVMHTSDAPKATDISAHFGLLNSFRLTSALDLNLDLRGTLVDDYFDGEAGGVGGEGMFTATIGLTYKFKERSWKRSKTITRSVYYNEEVNNLRERVREMDDENARLQHELAKSRKEKKTVATKNVASYLLTFKIGKSELSNEVRVNLGMFAEAIKQGDPDAVYTITGYADVGTGSNSVNERLSRARAEAVYNCLVNEFGVSKSQLKIDDKGGVDNMYHDDPNLSRAVIVTRK